MCENISQEKSQMCEHSLLGSSSSYYNNFDAGGSIGGSRETLGGTKGGKYQGHNQTFGNVRA